MVDSDSKGVQEGFQKFISTTEMDDLLDSTGVNRADSLMKLSSSGRPIAVFSNSLYPPSSSLRSGSTYSGWRHRSWTANVMVYTTELKGRWICIVP